MSHNVILTYSFCLGMVVFATGCGQKQAPQAASEPEAPHSILLSENPDSPMSVGKARQVAKPGQEVSIVGQIGGTPTPIAVEYASFVLADERIIFCDEMPGDACKAPWDACCEDPEKLATNRLSVILLDADEKPLSIDLRREANLTELDKVTITGIVADSSTSENLIIEASGLYRHTY